MPAPDAWTELELVAPIHLGASLGMIQSARANASARTVGREAWRAVRTVDGPGTLRVELLGPERARAEAWGPGAGRLIEAAGPLLGSLDAGGFEPPDGPTQRLARMVRGLRLVRVPDPWWVLAHAVVRQRVMWRDARESLRVLERRFGEPAPGPPGLLLPPDPEALASAPRSEFDRAGLEEKRAATLRRVAAEARAIDRLVDRPHAEIASRIAAIRGVGPWTTAQALGLAFGDPDTVPTGDYDLPHLVSFAFTGEARGDDARMLELLEPYRGHRFRVIRWLWESGITAPRFGPRRPRGAVPGRT